MKLNRTLWGSRAQKPFCVPRFLFVGNKLQPPWPSLSSKGQVQTVVDQGREGMQKQGRGSQETIVQGPGSPSKDTRNSIFELFCRTKTPTKWKTLTTWWSILHSREGHSLITLRTREAHQETTWGQIKGVQALHTPWSLSATPPLNLHYKTPHQIPLGWDTVFEGTSSLCPPLPGKAI